ncbi:P-loop NTPase fold protein [Mongoliitalea daihaiensis]|uniref:P-loop NTPase fold protein n=1 Tax=Mongoliitalea daihaiensis TaxID=2782006 RepID=UPI001F244AEE|nr:P-loop NTPase fold protein [Mongoliitalea daihaiensis]UJP65124.1 NTPase KAP [Mongoliitalea daihaiensis]
MGSKTFQLDTPRNHSVFRKHLDDPDNVRIIFSAPFGSGKTTFLKDFFIENKNEYQAFHLYPVNYSVSSNEDIFELIKYDILFHFLSLEIEFEKVTITKDVSFGFFVQNNIENIIMPFIRSIPRIGKALSDVSSNLLNLYKKFEIEHQHNQVDQKKQVIDFLTQLNKKIGSIKDDDFYTQLICDLMAQIKADNTDGKKTVLIIDDLDRIDPDHIFRILNVFSAHMDNQTKGNKFDFDKIILVCDIDNIRKIYAKRYGQDVDFSGYIDKFYSKEVFKFDIIKEVEEKLLDVFGSIELTTSGSTHNLERIKSYHDVRLVIYIIVSLNNSGQLPIRKLLKFIGKKISITISRFSPQIQGKYLTVDNFRFLIVYELLKSIYPDMLDLMHKLESINEDSQNNSYADAKEHYLNLLIPFLTYSDHLFEFETNKEISGTYIISPYKIEWKLIPEEKSGDLVLNPTYKIFKDSNQVSVRGIHMFKLVKETIHSIEKNKLNWLEN